MKLAVTCKGHVVELNLSKVGPALVGSVTSAEFGAGTVRAREVATDSYEGEARLDGYEASFSMKVDTKAKTCAGEIKYGWMFREPFEGTVA